MISELISDEGNSCNEYACISCRCSLFGCGDYACIFVVLFSAYSAISYIFSSLY